MSDRREGFTTSQLAAAADVGPQTLRYYERRGLLPEPPRTPGGHRIYGPEHLERLRFIQSAQSLGFDLQEVDAMLAASSGGGSSKDANETADRLVTAIDEKLAALRDIRAALAEGRTRAGGAELLDPLERAVFEDGRMGKVTLFASHRLLVGLNTFEPGQEHRLHTHQGMDKVYHVLAGEGRFLLADGEIPMTAGQMLVAPDGVPHGVRNDSGGRLVLLAVLAPAP